MNPLTAALDAYVATTKLLTLLWEGASPEQKQRLIELHLKREEWWQARFDKLGELLTKD